MLASYLAQYFSVDYADFEISIGRPSSTTLIKRYERKIREFFSRNEYDILALSCWTSLSYLATLTTARIFREMYPDKLIVVGGYHPSARPNEFIAPEHLFDYVICGEGELALREIAANLAHAGRPTETKIVKAPLFGVDDFVAPNWEIAERFLAELRPEGVKSLYLYLSRGCPFDCAFCMEGLKERRWRAATPESSINTLKAAHDRFEFVSVAFCDACFGMRPAWRKEFLHRLVDLHPDYWIVVETRPEYLDKEDIKLLANLKVEVQFGIESCSHEMLRIMKKSKQPQKFLDAFREVSHKMSDHGVLHRANMIFNHPGETHRTLAETYDFIDTELKNANSTLIWATNQYMHFPGCELDTNQAFYEQQYGTRFLSPEWWKLPEDQYTNSLRTVPSTDLADDVDRWYTMLLERDVAMRGALSDTAFRFAARRYYPEWTNDRRYRKD
jgi:radical SAM superfamily enzyme YgiQ (UPF0313 family)